MRPESPVVSTLTATEASQDAETENDGNGIVTTIEEIEGFHIVKSILREVIDPRRVFMRDSQSYCAVLMDDNNRKPICRLHFNNSAKLALGLFNGKDEERVPLADVDGIYNYADRLKAIAATYPLIA